VLRFAACTTFSAVCAALAPRILQVVKEYRKMDLRQFAEPSLETAEFWMLDSLRILTKLRFSVYDGRRSKM
jgi:hypothetical protein